ncbi:Leucine rich repeat protein [Spraguea lophii 42_110]|uniref:Leucine rich repeat protein n=1 Tax=Spraguea lophii (strain 42_110) TaxID=1358809 RepID=S7XL91_SPRLO|nr:Leucine rich repeat protein [Spraguea lophii 42_110]
MIIFILYFFFIKNTEDDFNNYSDNPFSIENFINTDIYSLNRYYIKSYQILLDTLKHDNYDIEYIISLDIKYNKILDCLGKFKKLKAIDVTGNTMDSLKNIPVFKEVIYLNVSFTQCKKGDIIFIGDKTVYDLDISFPKLLFLDISYNFLVTKYILKSNNVESLIYRTNILKNDEIGSMFNFFTNLKELKLKTTSIIYLQLFPQTFYNLKNLELSVETFNINMIHYKIESLNHLILKFPSESRNIFRSAKLAKVFPNLKILNMNDNSLEFFPHIFNCRYLQILYLKENNIKNICSNAYNLKNLYKIQISNNSLDSIYCLTQIINLKVIIANNNRITEICDEIENLKDLLYLRLCRNRITRINRNVFKLEKLRNLDLTGNNIMEIPDFPEVCRPRNLNPFINNAYIITIAKTTESNNLVILFSASQEIINYFHQALNYYEEINLIN